MAPARVAGRVALALGGVLVALAVLEVAVRIAGLTPARFHAPRQLENAAKTVGLDAYPTNPRDYFDVDLRDPATRARFAAADVAGLDVAARRAPFAVAFRYDAHRCRGAAPGLRAPGVARVLVLGDSFTEGEGVREADAFAPRLGALLRASGYRVEVLNCGRRGRDFPALYDAFGPLVAAYAPDVVLYAMVLNDAVQSPAFRARQGFLNDWILDRRRTLSDASDDEPPRGVRLVALVRDRVDALRVGSATTRWYNEMYAAPNAEGWARTRGYLAQMRDAMAARRGRFVVALLPLLVRTDGDYPFLAPHAEVRRACAAAGIPFADLLSSVRDEPPAYFHVHPVDLHPNERAHDRFAHALVPLVTGALDAASAR